MRIIQSDAETGEILGNAVVGVIYRREQNCFGMGWMAMAQDALMTLATADLGGERVYRVLFSVLARVDFENYILLNQSEIAHELRLDKADVSRSVKKLEALGVLLKGPKAGRSTTYRLNPNFGWKGKAQNHRKALDEAMRERMKAAGIRGVVAGSGGSPLSERDDMEQSGQMRLPLE
ncbi:MAG: replication/maintenance protein RepL [Halothiobacillaceae bacterium]